MQSRKYEELTAKELQEALKGKSLVYFPVGSLEFHGPHLPFGFDTLHAYHFCLRAAAETGGIVLPPTFWGTTGHVGWVGSLLVSEETFRGIVRDVFRLLAEQGVKLVVATTGHWPEKQGGMIATIAQEAMKARPQTRVLVLDPFTANPTDRNPGHAGLKETALMMFLRPELVHTNELKGEDAFKGIGKDCVDATACFGADYFEASLANFVQAVNETWEAVAGS
jgi:creatinine amidohydrolase